MNLFNAKCPTSIIIRVARFAGGLVLRNNVSFFFGDEQSFS